MNVNTKSVAPVRSGMAGVIYTAGAPSTAALDESRLASAFASGAWTTQTEWRSDDVLVMTFQHAHEGKTAPGSSRRPLPSEGRLSGLVFGHFFATGGPLVDVAALTRGALSAFQTSGRESFAALNGAWTGVVWNRERREAHFVRDRLGIETLYVVRRPDRIVFASDLRVLHAGGEAGELDEQAAAEFLHYLYVPAPRTIGRNGVAVLPGHVLTIGQDMAQRRWAASRFVPGAPLARPDDFEREIDAHLPEFESLLLQAVADSLPPTGRVALTISGGKDSSTLAVALSKVCPDRVLALNVGSKDQRFDESQDAALVCKALGLEFRTYVPSDDELATGIYDFAGAQDQPWGDIAALPYFLGMSRLPSDCTVVIDGTGNDWYFGIPSHDKGFVRYKRRAELQRYVPDALWPAVVGAASFGPASVRRLTGFWSKPIEETFVAWEGWTAGELARLLKRDVSFADTYLWEVMRTGTPERWLELITDVICGVWEPHAAYRKAVHFAHAAGRGIRFPFMDGRLADFINRLPLELKIRNGVNKQILRAYMKKNLPAEIINKPKSPFVFDLNSVLMNPKHRWVDTLEADGLLKVCPGWSDEPIRDLLGRYRDAPHDARWQQRVYALSLLATVVALKNGYEPRLRRSA